MTKTDLYNCNIDLQKKYELAENIADYWKENCTDDDFYDNCIENIVEELGDISIDNDNCISKEVYEIWNIIEENFLY